MHECGVSLGNKAEMVSPQSLLTVDADHLVLNSPDLYFVGTGCSQGGRISTDPANAVHVYVLARDTKGLPTLVRISDPGRVAGVLTVEVGAKRRQIMLKTVAAGS